MNEYLEQCLTGPNLLPTILLGLILLYGVLVILGALDIELFDFDLDADADLDASLTSIGFVALRFLNIGNVPLMIWVTVFGIAWWAASMLIWFLRDQAVYEPGWSAAAVLVFRNVCLALVAAKLVTQPLVRVFAKTDHYAAADLIGRQCVVETSQATPEYGQAKFLTDGAPLLLDIKTEEEILAKGDRAVIVDFDPETRVYLVTKANQEV